jgi:hypothetical protein
VCFLNHAATQEQRFLVQFSVVTKERRNMEDFPFHFPIQTLIVNDFSTTSCIVLLQRSTIWFRTKEKERLAKFWKFKMLKMDSITRWNVWKASFRPCIRWDNSSQIHTLLDPRVFEPKLFLFFRSTAWRKFKPFDNWRLIQTSYFWKINCLISPREASRWSLSSCMRIYMKSWKVCVNDPILLIDHLNDCCVSNDIYVLFRSILSAFSVRKIGLNESVVGNIMFQIMDGLAYTHSNGILHRDIKVTCLFVWLIVWLLPFVIESFY